jgi:hypothetical protein
MKKFNVKSTEEQIRRVREEILGYEDDLYCIQLKEENIRINLKSSLTKLKTLEKSIDNYYKNASSIDICLA